MTQNEHTFVALILLLIIYQIIFHKILKHHPVAQKNRKELWDIFRDYF